MRRVSLTLLTLGLSLSAARDATAAPCPKKVAILGAAKSMGWSEWERVADEQASLDPTPPLAWKPPAVEGAYLLADRSGYIDLGPDWAKQSLERIDAYATTAFDGSTCYLAYWSDTPTPAIASLSMRVAELDLDMKAAGGSWMTRKGFAVVPKARYLIHANPSGDACGGQAKVGEIALWGNTPLGAMPTLASIVAPKDARVHDLAEVRFQLDGGCYDNPFDPDEVDVRARVTPEGGAEELVPAFLTQDAAPAADPMAKDRFALVPGTRGFAVRFSPRKAVPHTVVLEVIDAQGKRTGEPFVVPVGAALHEGPWIVDVSAPWRFRAVDGPPLLAVGQNAAWTTNFENYPGLVAHAAEGGVNLLRVWLAGQWSTFELEWKGVVNLSDGPTAYGGLSSFNLENAWKIDRVVADLAKRGMAAQLVLGTYTTFYGAAFDANPYKEVVGSGLQFYSSEAAKKAWKKRVRYAMARWGRAPGVAVVELMNEADQSCLNPGDVASRNAWHLTMRDEVKAWARADMPVTTSFAWMDHTNQAKWFPWKDLAALELASPHLYCTTPECGTAPISAWSAQAKYASDGKHPVLLGETGRFCTLADDPACKSAEPLSSGDPYGVLLGGSLWAPVFLASAAGTSMQWRYDGDFDLAKGSAAMPNAYYPRLRAFRSLADELRASLASLAHRSFDLGAGLAAGGFTSSTEAVAWVTRTDDVWVTSSDILTTASGATLPLEGLEPGNYRVRVIHPYDGRVRCQVEASVGGDGKLAVALPPFRRDVAVRVTPAKGATLPFGDCTAGPDADGVLDELDVCPFTDDPGQADQDADGRGDACDPCANDPDDACLEPPPPNGAGGGAEATSTSATTTASAGSSATGGIGGASPASGSGGAPDAPTANDGSTSSGCALSKDTGSGGSSSALLLSAAFLALHAARRTARRRPEG